jgi:hypothetical protein
MMNIESSSSTSWLLTRNAARRIAAGIAIGGLDEPLDLTVGKIFTAALANCYIY